MRHTIVTTALLLMSVVGLTAAERVRESGAVYGPSICVDARFWDAPGWQSRDGDYASVQIGPGRNAAADVQGALKAIPPNRRMVRFASMAGAEQMLHQLVEVQGLRLASLAYDPGDPSLTLDASLLQARWIAISFGRFASRRLHPALPLACSASPAPVCARTQNSAWCLS